jgi:hypothetical protein
MGVMAIADMELAGPLAHALGNGMGRREYQVIGGKIEPFNRKGHERQVGAVPFPNKRQALDERGPCLLEDPMAVPVGQKIYEAVKVSIGIKSQHLLDHLLRSSIGYQPIMNDGNLHGFPR